MDELKELKYAIFDEWSYDPPGGSSTYYYDMWSYDEDDMADPIPEILEHIEVSAEDEDISEISPFAEDGSFSIDDIKSWSWDNGGVGCGCVAYAEGTDIGPEALDFYHWALEDFACDYYEDEDSLNRAKEIVASAKEKPSDHDAIIELLELISELIEARNGAMY